MDTDFDDQFYITRAPRRAIESLADDVLRGAGQIAAFLFGEATARRRVYDLADSGRLPIFRLGTTICARRSTLMAWIAAQERASREVA
ncbi:hypothetical protein [Brevundimonas sp. KM4]|uniref:hypothetical protein n=1 Tax=Brevundimonas sp. KM4 TaxID=1628191 RepID=UPI0005F85E63|nr:hypothetical protein [Brevundimonas sp. KM4]KJV41504.1 hypothetical protein VH88_08610 [Brevundimonas sp. KM4]